MSMICLPGMDRQKIFSVLGILFLVGAGLFWGNSSAANEPPNRQVEILVSYTQTSWWLLRWSDNENLCTITTEDGLWPSGEDVLRDCDESVYLEWKNTPACEINESTPSTADCIGLYLMQIHSQPAEKTIRVELPPAQVFLSLDGCTPTSLENRCPNIPNILLTGDEPLPNEKIEMLYARYRDTLFTCQGASCSIPLRPSTLDGDTIEFWANSSFGDTTQHFTALVRVIESAPTGGPIHAGWYVDVLSSQWRGSSVASCAEVWNAFPPVGGPPMWLTTPAEPALLASEEPYFFLAGRLIAQGAVDASECPSNGMLENGYANACGLEKAWPLVMVWQNQFDQTIIEASQATNVPGQLMKNIFSVESQFWPGVFKDPQEFGLGQITDNGAEVILLWNQTFYNQFCPYVLDEQVCNQGYAHLNENDQATLRGALALQAKSDCDDCDLGVDLSHSNFSISLFAETLRANCTQVARVVYNASGQSGGQVSTFEDMWRFTVANYHAGPGCVSYAIHQAWNNHQELSWPTVSQYFTPPCQGVISYTEKITR